MYVIVTNIQSFREVKGSERENFFFILFLIQMTFFYEELVVTKYCSVISKEKERKSRWLRIYTLGQRQPSDVCSDSVEADIVKVDETDFLVGASTLVWTAFCHSHFLRIC